MDKLELFHYLLKLVGILSNQMNALIQKAKNRFKIYSAPFWRHKANLEYQIALEQHITNLPVISFTDMNLVQTLKNEGVVVTSLEELGIPSNFLMLQSGKNLMSKMVKETIRQENEFVIHASTQQIMEHPEIFFWGLEQRLLDIVENFLGVPIFYDGLYFRRDTTNRIEKKSRLWHIDTLENQKQLKIIVYLNDVYEDGGPFEYIPKLITSKAAYSLKYNQGYIQDKTMEGIVSPSDYKSCIGPSGTVVLAATSDIFHRGKVPIASDRFTIFYDYTNRLNKQPFNRKYSLSHEHLLSLTEKLSSQQKKYVFFALE